MRATTIAIRLISALATSVAVAVALALVARSEWATTDSRFANIASARERLRFLAENAPPIRQRLLLAIVVVAITTVAAGVVLPVVWGRHWVKGWHAGKVILFSVAAGLATWYLWAQLKHVREPQTAVAAYLVGAGIGAEIGLPLSAFLVAWFWFSGREVPRG